MINSFSEKCALRESTRIVDPLGVDDPHTGKYNHIGPKNVIEVIIITRASSPYNVSLTLGALFPHFYLISPPYSECNCVLSQFTATPPSPTPLTFKARNAMRVYSNSYWMVIFCTTNNSRVQARERWLNFENSLKKKLYLMNTLYHFSSYVSFNIYS